MLAVSRDTLIEIWDLAAGAALAALEGHTGWAQAVAWSPDGTRLASAGEDGVVRVWDPAAGAALAALGGHIGWARAVAWSPDGTRLASAGDDGVRVSHARHFPRRDPSASGRVAPVGPRLRTSPGAVRSISSSPDGTAYAAAVADGSIALLPADPASSAPAIRLLGLPDAGWAVIYGEHHYRLNGDPAGALWWSSGLCRFEPGELDGYGVEGSKQRGPHSKSFAALTVTCLCAVSGPVELA
jgi:WD40 repeat protein